MDKQNDLDKLKQALNDYKQTTEILFELLDDFLDEQSTNEKPDQK